MHARSDKLVIAAFAAIVVFLGINFVAVKFSNNELPPFWGAALRFFVASALLFTVVKAKNIPLPKNRSLLGAILFGVLAFGLTYGLLYHSLLTVTSAMTSVIFATIPLFTLVFATIVGLEKITPRKLIGVAIVISGIVIVFYDQLQFNASFTSLIIVVLAAICASFSGIVVKYFPKSNPFSTNAVAMGIGAVLLFLGSFVFGEEKLLPTMTTTYIALGWLIFSSVMAFVLLVWIISKWEASRASYALVISPLVTIILASALLNETITISFLAGSLLVLLGVYTGALSNKSKE